MLSKIAWCLAIAAVGVVVGVTQSGDISPKTPPAIRSLPEPIHPSSSMEVLKLKTAEYLDRAKVAVLVKCSGRDVSRGPGGRNIFTYYTFETEEVIKGIARPRFQLRLFGGTIGDTSISMGISREFEPGAEYILMLGADNADGYPTLNPAAIFVVRAAPDSSRKVVVLDGSDLSLYIKSSGKRVQGTLDWFFLDDFIFSLQKAIQ